MTRAMDAPALDEPRSPRTHGRRQAARRSNFELYAWLFMRLSGVLLVFLALGHLAIQNIPGFGYPQGVHDINFANVAGRWSNIGWQLWDLAMLWLAELHGTNGLRTVINDYARKDTTRFWLKIMLYFSAFVVLIVGTYVIVTFDPTISS